MGPRFIQLSLELPTPKVGGSLRRSESLTVVTKPPETMLNPESWEEVRRGTSGTTRVCCGRARLEGGTLFRSEFAESCVTTTAINTQKEPFPLHVAPCGQHLPAPDLGASWVGDSPRELRAARAGIFIPPAPGTQGRQLVTVRQRKTGCALWSSGR